MPAAEPRPPRDFTPHRRRAVAARIALAALLAGVHAAAAEPALLATPLAAKSGPRGATMFAALPPEQTGIVAENRYADPRMWGERYHEFEVGSIGTGVAIGDYDHDGRPDIFVVSKTESCRLFRNLGNWKFEDVTAKAGVADVGPAAGEWKTGAAFVDVDNDGWLDLYVCRFDAPNLLYVNQRDGTFREAALARGLAVKDASGMAAFCDYDRDGWLDVYLQTNLLDSEHRPNGQRDYLFHNNRDGTFTNVTDHAGISGEAQGHSATWWDYDGDGWPDLYVANDFSAPDTLYHNNRDGTFTNVIDRVVPHTPFSSMGADLGDVNNDGLVDLLVADMAGSTHQKDQRGMAGARGLHTEDPDDPMLAPQYLRSALYLNTGTGLCLEGAILAGLSATDWTWSPRLEDLDNDGRLDLHVTNGMHRESHNSDLLSRVMTAETPGDRIRLMRSSPVFAETNFAFRNLGDLRFESIGPAWGLDQKGVSFGSAFGDLDGDGDLDLVFTNYQAGVTVLRNDSDTGHRLVVALRGTRSNRFGVGSTVRIETASGTQVRQLVLARGYSSTSEPILHFGLGNDTAIHRLTVTWPSGTVQTLTDLAADAKLTVTEPATDLAPPAPAAAPAPQFTDVSLSANFALASREPVLDELSQQPLLPFRQNRRGPALAVADVNGDGVDDVLVAGTPLAPARLLLGRGQGSFSEGDASAFGTDPTLDDGPFLGFDATGRGTADILVTKGGAALPVGGPEFQPKLFLNDGHGHLQPAPAGTLPPLSLSVGAAVAADFDRDGHLDVFLGARTLPGAYPLPPGSALLRNRGGQFEDVTDRLAPGLREIGLVTSALWTDVDGDGWLDLLVSLEWGGLRYWHNHEGRGFEDRSAAAGFAAAGSGWWNSLATADFNGDGRPDYVAGNLGLNTPYHADAEHPAVLFNGVFKEGGEPQIIEGYYEGDRLYPWRTRRQLGAKIPSILPRYPRNDAYARATLPEIIGEAPLAEAQRFAATEFQSGVFLSQPDGTYRFEPLPRIAQLSPLQGLVAGDFDGDGFADLYAVQNSYAPIPSIGRFDGGISQLLRGDGRGHLTPVPAGESGLIVTRDAKALAITDLDGDGWPDFLVTRNSGTTLAFRNGGVAGRHSFGVRLHGPVGNPTAIGARITVELANGSTQTAEIGAGGGYQTQSTAECFFGYPDGNAPKRLRVRWPSGATTEHELPAAPPSHLTLDAP